MSPMLPPLALTRYHRSPQRSAYDARRRSGLALRFNDPTRATALGWKNSSRSPRRWESTVLFVTGFLVTGFLVTGFLVTGFFGTAFWATARRLSRPGSRPT